MLNSCASNVTVVNIDAGFKAGYVAGLIARAVRHGIIPPPEVFACPPISSPSACPIARPTATKARSAARW
ncbi:MAG: hypothetical protein U0992_18040 [Planctomycetaceae bacterium]